MNLTRDIFRKACNYAYSIFQKGNAVLDPDVNDSRQIAFHLMKDMIDTVGLEGFLDSGFNIVEATVGNQTNNFNVTMGIGYKDGLRLYQEATASLVPTAFPDTQSQANLSSVIDAVTAESIIDYRMNLTVDALIGRKVYIFGSGIGVSGIKEYTVTSNTAQTIVFAGEDLVTDGITSKMLYTVKPSTPISDREDAILLNVFLDEVTPEEDSILYHSLGGNYENETRMKIRTVIEIEEGVDSSTYTVPSNYTDLLGNIHTYVLLGYLDRGIGVSTITNSEIVDARTDLKQLSDYVLKTGDTMTGTLEMSGADINLDTGDVTLEAGDIVLDAGNITLGDALLGGGGNITNYGGGVLIYDGLLRMLGGDILMASGSITGTCDGVIDFANVPGGTNDGVTGFSNISGKYITVLDLSGLSIGRFKSVETSLGDNVVALVDPHTDSNQKLVVATPVEANQASTKGYVDNLIKTHTHSEYVTHESLGRVIFSSFAGLTGISGGVWPHGTMVEVPHNLGDDFVVTTLQVHDGTYWEQPDLASFTIQILDSNTVGITNRTGASIDEGDARCCFIRAAENRSVAVFDLIGGEFESPSVS